MKIIATKSKRNPDYRDYAGKRNSTPKFILSLTRCCTQNCIFCAVDALNCESVIGCRDRSYTEQLLGRELTPAQWCSVIDKLIAKDCKKMLYFEELLWTDTFESAIKSSADS